MRVTIAPDHGVGYAVTLAGADDVPASEAVEMALAALVAFGYAPDNIRDAAAEYAEQRA